MPTSRTRLGNLGEELACRMLRDSGYAILATNYRCRWGEVDIVAQEGHQLVFVEVRTRSSDRFGTPEESVTEVKSQRLVSTAHDYLQNQGCESANWRIDLVSVRVKADGRLQAIDHLKNAVEG